MHGGGLVPGLHRLAVGPPPALYTTKGYRQSGWNTLNVWEKFFGSFSEAVSLYYTVGHENSCSVHALRMDHSVLLPNNRGK